MQYYRVNMGKTKQMTDLMDSDANTLTYIRTLEVQGATRNIVLVGNAYGIMPYIPELANKFSRHNIKPYWFPFSGQEYRPGMYCIRQGVEDLAEVIQHIRMQNSLEINILCHCAGSLIALKYLSMYQDKEVDKVIVYGLLRNPNRRRNIAERKLKTQGVKYAIPNEEWNHNPIESLVNIEKNILFCHPEDQLNLDRATKEEMMELKAFKNNIKLRYFEKGYDEDCNSIDCFFETYLEYLHS